jgi:hypothetical protein
MMMPVNLFSYEGNFMKRLTIIEMQNLAKERGGECLSAKYQNNNQNLLWRCKEGHTWNANANNVKGGTWCPHCATNIRLTIEEMHLLAKKNGGKCLSSVYVNSKIPLKWQCKNNHVWVALPTNVKSGSWCDICARTSNANKLRYGIEDLRQVAQANGGECLSETYLNAHTSMRWKCREGHVWQNCANNVRRGQWCDVCSSKKAGLLRRNTIDEMYRLAKERGGLCLSKEYLGNKIPLRWECAKGHQWEAAPSSVKSAQSWCMRCGFESSANLRKKDIQIMHDVAQSRGGECLSKTHKSVNTKLNWRCANGHEWSAAPVKILRGSWCPLCSSHLGERICREYLEQIFGYPFPKSRPHWLFNSEGNRAELDGYCSELSLAFEHHGQYHYQIDKLYSKTNDQLEKRQKDDRHKEQLCLENGVKVIVVPEIFTMTALENIIDVIENECVSKKIELSLNFKQGFSIDLKKAYASDYARTVLQELKDIAFEHGGQCLSEAYKRSSAKMKWQCRNGHIFEAPPNAVKRGSWCLKCSGHERLSIAEMKAIAEERGGKCLSEEYTNAHAKLKWQCAAGHIWEAIANSVKHRGTWCRRCSAALNYKNLLQKRSLKQN